MRTVSNFVCRQLVLPQSRDGYPVYDRLDQTHIDPNCLAYLKNTLQQFSLQTWLRPELDFTVSRVFRHQVGRNLLLPLREKTRYFRSTRPNRNNNRVYNFTKELSPIATNHLVFGLKFSRCQEYGAHLIVTSAFFGEDVNNFSDRVELGVIDWRKFLQTRLAYGAFAANHMPHNAPINNRWLTWNLPPPSLPSRRSCLVT